MVADAYDAVSTAGRCAADGGGAGRPLRGGRDQRRRRGARRVRRARSRGRRSTSWTACGPTSSARPCMAGTDQVCRPLVDAGAAPAELAAMTLGRGAARRRRWTGCGAGAPSWGCPPATTRRCWSSRRTGARGRRRRGAAAPAQGPADPDQPGRQHRHLPRDAAAPLPDGQGRTTDEGRTAARVPPAAGGRGGAGTDRHRARSTCSCGSAAPASAAPTCTSSRASGPRRWAPTLPYTLGHENAGWVHEVGSAVSSVAVGDTVILHPTPTCGLCRACRAGDDMHCANSSFPGLSGDGGMAEFLLTSERACVKLDPSTQPQGRRRARRRRHHRLPRRAQGRAAALPGHHRRASSAPAGSGTSASSAWPR